MKVLMISTDRSILVPGSAARERMREYGRIVDELHLVVFVRQKNFQFSIFNFQSISNDAISKNVFVYPTHSWSRWLYVFDAYRCAKRRIGNWKLEIGNSRDQRWLITSQDPFETGLVGVLLKRRFGAALQIQVHTDFLSPHFAWQSLLNRARVRIARFTLPRADCIRVVSERIRQSLSRVKCQMSNVATLPIFVDAARFSARPDEVAVREIRARYAQFGRLILMVGRLAQEKNIALAIEAMRDVVKAHPRTGFIVVGDGSEKSRYQLPVTSYQLQNNVIFESSAADLAPYYHAADIFLHTSNYEGYGMVLVEAAAAGLPIVTTDVGIVGDILRDGESAFVCPVGDRACIRERLLRLLGDETLQIRLGSAAQEAVMRHAVSKEEYVRKYQETWERCATSRVLEKNDENMDYTGVIIEESLENKDVLKEVHISSTKIEEVTAEHKTPWIKQWTLHTVKISENQADSVAGKISKALDRKHPWYADFKNNASHFVIFRDKFFKVDRSKKEQYDDVARFGVSLGIPDYQLDFSPQVKEWER